MEHKHYKARIEWYNDPSHYLLHTWLRDIVTIDGIVVDRQIIGQTWTVPVRITSFIDDTWGTYADVGFLVDEAPWHLLETGYTFRLWAGKDIATVTML
ncbi:hypothetical protein SK066_13825 [Paenibacillus hunanensis]|uniref:hypothetical protein n=1 Tax=Paenibacillus hunanensis TaxID=539262 RepID=UPI002A6B2DC6|nr:hypothetical protein [Paenibacillus hunanensis]WPP39702.1 hypothetical protein SK066_13825 [Paenibacillus hunanensis]